MYIFLPIGAFPKPGNLLWFLMFALAIAPALPAKAQIGLVDISSGLRIESVVIIIANQSADPRVNSRIEDTFRRQLAVYPNQIYSRENVDFAMAIARRRLPIAEATQAAYPGPTGGVVVEITLTIKAEEAAGKPRGLLVSGNIADFPKLYDYDGTFVTAKLETLGIYYCNGNSWYGDHRPSSTGIPSFPAAMANSGSKASTTSRWCRIQTSSRTVSRPASAQPRK